jgi:hypothetical protein
MKNEQYMKSGYVCIPAGLASDSVQCRKPMLNLFIISTLLISPFAFTGSAFCEEVLVSDIAEPKRTGEIWFGENEDLSASRNSYSIFNRKQGALQCL